MAQPLRCDVCQENQAVQMLTNLDNGQVMTLCPACLVVFYGQSILSLTDAGEHKGPANKCQACRRVHERMTTPVAPIDVEYDDSVPGASAEAPPEPAAEAT